MSGGEAQENLAYLFQFQSWQFGQQAMLIWEITLHKGIKRPATVGWNNIRICHCSVWFNRFLYRKYIDVCALLQTSF